MSLSTIFVKLTTQVLKTPEEIRYGRIGLVSGDRLPRQDFQFFAADGVTPRNLTGETPFLKLRMVGSPKLINVVTALTVDNAAQGLCHYDFAANDLATPGEMDGEVGVTTASGDFTVYELLHYDIRRQF